MAFIYVITNDVNGKQYVGKTLHDSIEERFKEHLRDAQKRKLENRPLYKAINKYGEKHFNIRTLEEVDPKNLSEREIFWIKELGTYGNHRGYNATLGGDGKQFYNYEEIRNLILSGLSRAEIMSKLGCGIEIISKVCKIYHLKSGYDLFKKPIDQMDLDNKLLRVFDSTVSAGKWIVDNKISSSKHPDNNIRECLYGKTETAYGFKWRFHNESDRPSHN